MPNKRSGRLISQIRGASNNARNASGQHNTSSNNQLVTSIRVFMIDSAGSGFEVLEFAPQLQLLLRDAGFDRPQPAFQSLETGLGSGRRHAARPDRQTVVSGKSVSVRVALGGRRSNKKK